MVKYKKTKRLRILAIFANILAAFFIFSSSVTTRQEGSLHPTSGQSSRHKTRCNATQAGAKSLPRHSRTGQNGKYRETVALLGTFVFMSEKAACNDDKRPSIDRYGCTGAKNGGEIC